MKTPVLFVLILTLTACGRKYELETSAAALEAVRSAARDVVVKSAEAEETLSTDEQRDALRRAKGELKQAEKNARAAGATEMDLWEKRRIGETEGKKIALEWVR
jgi:predicted small lipoprotein YifL